MSSVNTPRYLWPVLGGAFKILVLPPVWIGRLVGWTDLYDFMVLRGISVWESPSRFAMFWTHFVVAFPFWLATLVVLMFAVRGMHLIVGRIRKKVAMESG